ncbi:MAG TPA: AAA family ATPase, partial [Rubrobacter sp.]|nr:AAA family ATPase [Rubrobacter sp.]
TLARALCREGAERGALVLGGSCYDLSETPPYGPWSEVFGNYVPDEDLPPPPEAFAGAGAADAITTRSALFDGVRHFVATLAERRPAVMLLEDLHWADPESLEILRIVGRETDSKALLILATFRGDELARDHPLYQLLPVLERESGARRLELRSLRTGALHELVAARYRLTETNSARLVAYLFAEAGGNPFFTIQLLRALEEDEVLRPLGTRWVVGDLEHRGVPLPLRQVIDGRLLRLDEEGQGLLRVAAVVGQEVPFPLWASVVEREEEELIPVVEGATAARLIESNESGDGFRFVHALIREALYEGINPLRRRVVHRRVGETLAALPNPDPDAVAYHFQQAGHGRAAGWLAEAGERAERTSALLTAAERYERALVLAAAGGMDAAERGWLELRLAVLQRFRKPQEALAHAQDAERLARETNDPGLAARAPLVRGLVRVYANGIQHGLEDMMAGVEMVEELPLPRRARNVAARSIDAIINQGMLAAMLSWAGRLDEARRRGEAFLGRPADQRSRKTSRTAPGRSPGAWRGATSTWSRASSAPRSPSSGRSSSRPTCLRTPAG